MAAEAAARMTNEDPHDDRSAIMIFNLGAPSNIDLWDMKPDAPREIRGPFKPISTNNDTFQVSELLPEHAKIADKFSLVRSCHHLGAAVHDADWQVMQTGRVFQGGVETPHAESFVQPQTRMFHLKVDNVDKLVCPPVILKILPKTSDQ